MGTNLFSNAGFTRFSNPVEWDTSGAESNTVGQATAIGISAQGVSAAQLRQLLGRLELSRGRLEAKLYNGLSGEQMSGDVLSSAIWTWFSAAETHGWLTQAQANVVEKPGMSYGFFHASVQPIYSWGVIRQVRFPGVNIDMPHQRALSASRAGGISEWINFNRLRGQFMSGLEQVVPEKLFSDSSSCNLVGGANPKQGLPVCPEGVSAVKAIDIASQAGQKIFSITPDVYLGNKSIVQGKLAAHSQSTKERVQNYLDAGWEVDIHQWPVTKNGWTGAGFTAIDPTTGAGAYLVEGGANGGVLPLLAGFGLGAAGAAAMILTAALFPIWSFGAGLLFALSVILFLSVLILNLSVWTQTNEAGCFWQGVGLGGSAVGVAAGGSGIAGILGQIRGANLVPTSLRANLANAIAGFVTTVLYGTAGAFAPSNPVQDCV